jgi:hypothetical protein
LSLQHTAEVKPQHFQEKHIPRNFVAQQQVSPLEQRVNKLHLTGPGGGGTGGLGLDLVGYEANMFIPHNPAELSVFRNMCI